MMLPQMKSLVALASVSVLVSSASLARNVEAPLAGTVAATTYYPSGSFHGAVDIRGGTCGVTPVKTGAVGSLAWTVTIRSTATGCASSMPAQNEVSHAFANGGTFRIRSFLASAGSYNRTCDRCNIGTAYVFNGSAIVDPLHLQYDRYGTRSTSWYAGTVNGEALSAGEVVGIID